MLGCMLEEILNSKVEKLQKRMERPQAPRPVVAGAFCMRFLRYRFLRPLLRNSLKYPPVCPRSFWGVYFCVWAIYRENAKLIKTEKKRFCLQVIIRLKTFKNV